MRVMAQTFARRVACPGWLAVAAGLSAAAHSGVAMAACPGEGGAAGRIVALEPANAVRLDSGAIIRLAGIEVLPAGGEEGHEAAAGPILRGTAGTAVRVASPGPPDRYGRIPAQVVLPDGTWLQSRLVGAGAARVRPMPGEEACIGPLLAAEEAARAAGRGLWASPEYATRRADDPSLAARIGLYEVIEGRVRRVGNGSRMFFLDFGRDFRKDFTIMVPNPLASRLAEAGKPVAGLEGRRVRVRGVVEESGGPAIRLGGAWDIEVLDDDAGD